MAKMLLTVKLDADTPTVTDVSRHLGVSADDIDLDFGVVLIDPDDKRYAVMVDEAVVPKATRATNVAGPFSNPRIETTGPPEPAKPPRSRRGSGGGAQPDRGREDRERE